MPVEKEILFVQKAMAYDLVRIFESDPKKTYTPEELKELLAAYIKGLASRKGGATRLFYFSFRKYSMPMMASPSRSSSPPRTTGHTMFVSSMEVPKRPGGVDQAVTFCTLAAAAKKPARHQMEPMRDKKPPMSTFFISLPPLCAAGIPEAPR